MENGKDEKAEKPETTEEKPAAEKSEVDGNKVDNEDSTKVKEETDEPEVVTPELLEKIKSQVEFYFGDINMQRDKFLIEQTKLDEGWIPMQIMLKFKMLASLSKQVETILKAIEDSDLMEISEDRKKIRRRPDKPLPVYDEAYRKAQAERTVYVKGFPLEGVYVNQLKEFFKDFEPFENIVMRKWHDKEKKAHFKGSVFVQFKTLDGAKAFMARESVKYNDTELIRKFSEDYLVEKTKEREEKYKKKDGKGKKTDQKNETQEDGGEETKETDKSGIPKGTVLHFTGAGELDDREDIRKAIEDDLLAQAPKQIVYIEFNAKDEEGYVRFAGENSAKEVLDKMTDSKLEVEGVDLTFRLLEGKEEEEYLKKVKDSQLGKKQKKGGRKGKKKGGFAGAKKRSGGQVKSEPPAKQTKFN